MYPNMTTLLIALAALCVPLMGVVSAQEIPATPGQVFRDCPDCPEMVVVPRGQFTMGSPDSEVGRLKSEGPQHVVTIAASFAVSKVEVTRGQYAQFVRDSKHVSGNACVVWTGNHPVVCITWHDANAYVDWLTRKTHKAYALLSEPQWEYAARAGACLDTGLEKVKTTCTRTPMWPTSPRKTVGVARTGNMRIAEAVSASRRRLWVRSLRTRSVSMTCTRMCGSGLRIATMTAIPARL